MVAFSNHALCIQRFVCQIPSRVKNELPAQGICQVPINIVAHRRKVVKFTFPASLAGTLIPGLQFYKRRAIINTHGDFLFSFE